MKICPKNSKQKSLTKLKFNIVLYVLANLSVIWRNILTTLLLGLVMIIFMKCYSAYGKKTKRAKVFCITKDFKMKGCIFLKKSLQPSYLCRNQTEFVMCLSY